MAHSPFAEDAAPAAELLIPLGDEDDTEITQTNNASIDDTQGNDVVKMGFSP